MAEGEKVVRRLLSSGLEVSSLLITPEWLERLTVNSPTSIPDAAVVYVAPRALLESIVGFSLHQGIMAVGRVPASQSLDSGIASIRKPYLLTALDGLVNAENVGVVVRNCAAFGVDAIVVGETSSSPYLRRAVRNSMGAVFGMKIFHVTDLADALRTLRTDHGTTILGAHPGGRTQLSQANLRESICIVFGNEGTGLSSRILAVCDELVAIPMMNSTDSLNVASASAVVLFEVRRQRDQPADR